MPGCQVPSPSSCFIPWLSGFCLSYSSRFSCQSHQMALLSNAKDTSKPSHLTFAARGSAAPPPSSALRVGPWPHSPDHGAPSPSAFPSGPFTVLIHSRWPPSGFCSGPAPLLYRSLSLTLSLCRSDWFKEGHMIQASQGDLFSGKFKFCSCLD